MHVMGTGPTRVERLDTPEELERRRNLPQSPIRADYRPKRAPPKQPRVRKTTLKSIDVSRSTTMNTNRRDWITGAISESEEGGVEGDEGDGGNGESGSVSDGKELFDTQMSGRDSSMANMSQEDDLYDASPKRINHRLGSTALADARMRTADRRRLHQRHAYGDDEVAPTETNTSRPESEREHNPHSLSRAPSIDQESQIVSPVRAELARAEEQIRDVPGPRPWYEGLFLLCLFFVIWKLGKSYDMVFCLFEVAVVADLVYRWR